MSDEPNFNVQMDLPRDHLHAATAALLLQAMDLAFRHDLRPQHGPLGGSSSLNARQLVACELVNWSLGNTTVEVPDPESGPMAPAYGPGSITDPERYRDE